MAYKPASSVQFLGWPVVSGAFTLGQSFLDGPDTLGGTAYDKASWQSLDQYVTHAKLVSQLTDWPVMGSQPSTLTVDLVDVPVGILVQLNANNPVRLVHQGKVAAVCSINSLGGDQIYWGYPNPPYGDIRHMTLTASTDDHRLDTVIDTRNKDLAYWTDILYEVRQQAPGLPITLVLNYQLYAGNPTFSDFNTTVRGVLNSFAAAFGGWWYWDPAQTDINVVIAQPDYPAWADIPRDQVSHQTISPNVRPTYTTIVLKTHERYHDPNDSDADQDGNVDRTFTYTKSLPYTETDNNPTLTVDLDILVTYYPDNVTFIKTLLNWYLLQFSSTGTTKASTLGALIYQAGQGIELAAEYPTVQDGYLNSFLLVTQATLDVQPIRPAGIKYQVDMDTRNIVRSF